jgi:predicted ATPase
MIEAKTKKYVLTGGPSCGKSTTISELKKQGFSVLEEVAREFIQKKGRFPTHKKDIEDFQMIMFNEQLKRESNLTGPIVFLDRGLGDYHAYSKHLLDYIPETLKQLDFRQRYDKIFILERLPFVDDGLRIESGEEEAERIHSLIIRAYKQEGYNPVFVPVMPVPERTNYILEKIT